MAKDDKVDEIRKPGILFEAMQDDIEKILEVVSGQQRSISKIPKMAERIEKLEYNISSIKLATSGTNSDLRLIKIRTEKLEDLLTQVKDHEHRIAHLEAA